MTIQSDSIYKADSRNSINHSASFLFEDKGGLARFGGMAASVTAVAQVAEQFIGNGLYAALVFSFLVAIYYSRRAFQLRFLDCLVWVPIYTCVVFVTALGSNNVVGLSREQAYIPLDEYQAQIEYYKATTRDYEEAIKKKDQLLEKYKMLRDMVTRSFEAGNLKDGNNVSRSHHMKERSEAFSLFDVFSPKSAYAQENHSRVDTTRPAPPIPEAMKALLREIEKAEQEQKQLPEKPEEREPEPEVKQQTPKVWQKW